MKSQLMDQVIHTRILQVLNLLVGIKTVIRPMEQQLMFFATVKDGSTAKVDGKRLCSNA